MSQPWSSSLVVASFGVITWRVVTFVQLVSGQMEGVVEDPAILVLLRGGMGLLLVACGLAMAHRELLWAKAFGWYCVTYGLHWGGPIIVSAESQAHAPIFLFYFLVSGAVAHSCLLLWFYSYPSRSAPAWLKRAVLVPPGMALLAGGLGLSSGSAALVGTAQAIIGVWPTVATVLGLVALSVSASRGPAVARQRQLRLIGLFLAAVLPWEIASAFGYDELAAWLTLLFSAPAVATVIWARREPPFELTGNTAA